MSHQNRYQTPAYLKKKKRKLIIKISLISFLSVTIFVAMIYLFNYQKFQIVAIEISETQFVEQSEITKEIEGLLSGKNFLLFKKTNSLFIRRKKISNEIVNKFLPIKGADVRVDNKIVKVEVSEFEPVALYCQIFNIEHQENSDNSASENLNLIEEKDGLEKCFLMNNEGQIFYQLNDLDNLVIQNDKLIEFRGMNFQESPLGYYYFDSERFGTLHDFAEGLSKIDMKVNTINTNDKETFEVKIDEGPSLLIESNDESAVTLLNNLKTTIEIEEINDIQFKNLEYIDLRFGKNIYYKIK